MSLIPATLPPEYLPLKKKLMSGRKAEFASLRRQDLRLRLFEILSFALAWLGGAALALSASTIPNIFLRLSLQTVGVFVCGVSLFVFFLEVHEGMHNLLFKNKTFNDAVSFLFCLPLFLSFGGATVLHLRHHRYLGAQGDPDEYRLYAKTRLRLWLLYYGRLFVSPLIYIFLIPILGYRYGTSRQRLRILVEGALMACFYVSLFSLVPFFSLWLIWILPSFLTGFLIGLWGLAQHAFNNASDPLLASRSIRTSRLVSFCFIQQNYHLEHHLFPEIPSYHLRRACQIIWPQLPHALIAHSYTGFMLEFIGLSFRLEDKLIGYTELMGC